MGRMQRILDAYRAGIVPRDPRNFAVFAGGPRTNSAGFRLRFPNVSDPLAHPNALKETSLFGSSSGVHI